MSARRLSKPGLVVMEKNKPARALASDQTEEARWRLYDEYYRAERWVDLRAVLKEDLRQDPDDHWLLTRIGLTYYEQRNYKEALTYSEKAIELEPACPLALWDYAGTLDMLGRDEEAVRLWEGLLERGVEAIAHGDCGEGVRWARSLLNDCRYRIARIANEHQDLIRARTYYEDHLKNRRAGQYSVYTRVDVQRRLRDVLQHLSAPDTTR